MSSKRRRGGVGEDGGRIVKYDGVNRVEEIWTVTYMALVNRIHKCDESPCEISLLVRHSRHTRNDEGFITLAEL